MIAFTSISLALASLAVAAPAISPIPSDPTELSLTEHVLLKVANQALLGAPSVYIGGANYETGNLQTTNDPYTATQVHFKKVPQISHLVGQTQYYEMVGFAGTRAPLVVLNEQGHLMFGGSTPARSPPMGTWTSSGVTVPTESAVWYVNGKTNELEASFTVLGSTKPVKMGLCYHVDPTMMGADALFMKQLNKDGGHNCGVGAHGLITTSILPRPTTAPVVDLD